MSSAVFLSPGNRQQLSALLKYHLGEGLVVSGGVGSHTRIKPLLGDKLELGVVGAGAGASRVRARALCALVSPLTPPVAPQRNYTVFVNRVPVAHGDLMATNGVVHGVDSIVKPLRESDAIPDARGEPPLKTASRLPAAPKVHPEQADGPPAAPRPSFSASTSSLVRIGDVAGRVTRSQHTKATLGRW